MKLLNAEARLNENVYGTDVIFIEQNLASLIQNAALNSKQFVKRELHEFLIVVKITFGDFTLKRFS